MAIVKRWGFGDNVTSTTDINPSVINPTQFALVQDEPDECRLSQQDTVDNREMLSYSAKDVGGVGTYLKAAHPVNQKNSVTYTIRLDEQLLLTSEDEASYSETVPVVAMVTIRHPKNGNIAVSDIDTIFNRLIGAAYKTVDGQVVTRFSDLMQSALKPTSDGLPSA